MNETIPLGRIAGIRVGLNWTVLVIFALVVFLLAFGRLPVAYPGYPGWAYWVAGIVTALVFFGSLLLHELGHAIVARRNNMRVDGITLWLLGGVARIRDEAASPAAEVRITGVGPLISLLLGIGFAVLGVVVVALTGPGLVAEAVVWLAAINVLLAVFNVIPAAPLDGGRLLRAFLWWYTGDRVRSTVRAARAGRIVGWAFVAISLLLVFLGPWFSAIWLALIGFFLITAATAEGSHAEMRAILGGVPVRVAMSGDLTVAPAETTVTEFVDGSLFRYRHSAFPVVRGDSVPVGLVTVHQVRQVPPDRRASTTLEEVMTPVDEAATTTSTEPLSEALPLIETSPDHRALVVDDGQLVGIVTPSDVSRVMAWLSSRGQAPADVER